MELRLSGRNPNTRENSERVFVDGGAWERNQGRRQTRLFAEYFHRNIRVPLVGPFTVLDVGCGLGDALPVWHERYPEARLFGCDVAQVAVDRCTETYGQIASFFRASFEDIRGNWDVIFCSNTLEHFEQRLEIAELLLGLCRILYVITPYRETWNGEPLTPATGEYHVSTFDRSTFSSIQAIGLASITTKVIRAPEAWGPSWKGEIKWALRRALGRARDRPPRQIIYSIRKTASVESGIKATQSEG